MSERSLFAPEYNDDEPSLPEVFKPYLQQPFVFDWAEDGVACFSAAHPTEGNCTFLECMFDQLCELSRELIMRKRSLSFGEIRRMPGAEFKTKSLIPGDKNLTRAQWSAEHEKATRSGTAGFFNGLGSGCDLTWS